MLAASSLLAAAALQCAACGSLLGVDFDNAHLLDSEPADAAGPDQSDEIWPDAVGPNSGSDAIDALDGSARDSDNAIHDTSADSDSTCVRDDAADCAGKCAALQSRCGDPIDCGGCPDGQNCGGGGPNVCGTCAPDCAGKTCGASDGCNGWCAAGSCSAPGLHCSSGSCVCDPTSCTGCCALGKCFDGTDSSECGSSGADCTQCNASQTCTTGNCENNPVGWTSQYSSTSSGLYAVWGSGAGDVYAVGEYGQIIHSTGDGSWTQQLYEQFHDLHAAWGSAANLIYAGGEGGYFWHSTGGGTWQEQGAGASGNLAGIWGAGSIVYVVDSSGADAPIWELSGGGASPVCYVSARLWAVWGSSGGDIYAVGMANGPVGAIYHLTGIYDPCTPQTSGTTQLLYAVWGSAANDIYVVGTGGTILHSAGDGTWTPQASGTSDDLRSVWGSASNDLYAVGNAGTILHSGGDGTWTKQDSGTSAALFGVWGSGSIDVYVVGDGGTVLHRE